LFTTTFSADTLPPNLNGRRSMKASETVEPRTTPTLIR
jgi:hypothetical protein